MTHNVGAGLSQWLIHKALAFCVILAPLSAQAADPWRTEDTWREVGFAVVLALDHQQTLTIARNPQEWYELNPLLGKHPSVGKVNNLFLLSAIAHPIVSYLLPTDKCLGPICDWRSAFQWTSIVIEGGAVVHNISVGINF